VSRFDYEALNALKMLEWACSGVDYMESEYVTQLAFARATLARARMVEHAPEMLKALQRLTHPAADDEDLAYALEVIAKATGGQS
jgi:hypothetical protein